MARLVLMFLVVAGLVMSAPIAVWSGVEPYDPNTMNYPITPQQAEQAAKDWFGTPTPVLSLTGVLIVLGAEGLSPYYEFHSTTDQMFYVDSSTGELVLWRDTVPYNAYLAKQPPTWIESTQLSTSQLRSSVEQFLTAKFTNFASLNMQQVRQDDPTLFYWQTLSSGARYKGTSASCLVDKWNGEVVQYVGEHGPAITISSVPSVSSTEAEQVAINYAGLIPMHINGETVYPQSAFVLNNLGLYVALDSLGVQRLIWEIRLVLSDEEGYDAEAYVDELENDVSGTSGEVLLVQLDAQTGEVFFSDPDGPLGGNKPSFSKKELAAMVSRRPQPAKLKQQPKFKKCTLEWKGSRQSDLMYPAFLVDGSPYLYAGYLKSQCRAKVDVSGSNVLITLGDKQLKLRLSSKSATVGDKTINLSHAPRMIANNLYLPVSLLDATGAFKTSWDAASNTVKLTLSSGGTSVSAKGGLKNKGDVPRKTHTAQ